jgi:hypothetical protein
MICPLLAYNLFDFICNASNDPSFVTGPDHTLPVRTLFPKSTSHERDDQTSQIFGICETLLREHYVLGALRSAKQVERQNDIDMAEAVSNHISSIQLVQVT